MQVILEDIISSFEPYKNAKVAEGMKAYMRDKFAYLGIKSPIRKEISKPIVNEISKEPKSIVYPIIKALWEKPEREFHYLALDIYYRVAKKMMDETDIEMLEWMILQNSWWDTIDFISPKLVRLYFERYPEKRNEIVDKWIASNNIWLQRSTLLFHLKQKDEVDFYYMIETIERLTGSKEFFINKAIGWLLREHSKRLPEEIRDYILSNQDKLAPLSVREGLKYCG